MKYKNAFQCSKTGECPKSNGEDGCPAWIEIVMSNRQTGETRIDRGCNFQMLPFLIVESIKAADVTTNTVSSIKNEIGRGYSLMAQAIPEFVMRIAENTDKDKD